MIVWKLNEVLAARRIKGQDLANHLGVHKNSVSRLRQARKMPRIDNVTMSGICEFLKCQPGDLLEWVPDDRPDSGNA